MTRFHEEQRFSSTWVILLGALAIIFVVVLAVVALASGRPRDLVLLPIAPLVFAALAAIFWRARLLVHVDDRGVTITFRYIWPTRRIAFANIAGLEVRRYSGLLEYGGWGVRLGLKGWAYVVGGTEGVQLQLRKGLPVLIGSNHAPELEAAIRAGLEAAR